MKERNDDYRLRPDDNRKLGKAMHDYSMFADGDRVLIAVSGGIDSLTLAYVLQQWIKKIPITITLHAVYVDHGFWKNNDVGNPGLEIQRQLDSISLPYEMVDELPLYSATRNCFVCSKNRRKVLFDYAAQGGYNKLALGHHRDDLIETFFLNVLYGGNISTMLPRQELFSGDLQIVRPMAYLEKCDVQRIGSGFGVRAVKNLCPVMDDSRREQVREVLEQLGATRPEVKSSIFAALSNVRQEYLLS